MHVSTIIIIQITNTQCANPFHHSSVIGAVSGNNEVSMWDMETATRRQMLWASSLLPFSKMTDDVSNVCVKLYSVYTILYIVFFECFIFHGIQLKSDFNFNGLIFTVE